jgi:hypothetical protein
MCPLLSLLSELGLQSSNFLSCSFFVGSTFPFGVVIFTHYPLLLLSSKFLDKAIALPIICVGL